MDLEEITFVRSPAKHGWISKKDDVTGEVVKEQTYVFTIPQTYIRSGIIDTKKKYRLRLEPLEESKHIFKNLMEKVDSDFVEGKVDPELYHQLRTKYEDKFYDRENETKDQKRERILKIIYGLDERLSFGHIDQETYYKLSDKYNKILEELGPEEEVEYVYEDDFDEDNYDYGDIDLS